MRFIEVLDLGGKKNTHENIHAFTGLINLNLTALCNARIPFVNPRNVHLEGICSGIFELVV